jgi:hypothetical protein
MKLVVYTSVLGDRRSAYRILVGRPEGKRRLGKPKREWDDNIKMNYQNVGWGSLDWPVLAQDIKGSQTMSPLIFNCLCARNFQIV